MSALRSAIAVVEGLLPAREPLLERGRVRLGLGQLAGQRGDGRRVLLRRALGDEVAADLLGDGEDVVHHAAPGQPVGLPEHPLAQVADQLGEAGLGVELRVAVQDGVPAQGRRHREDLRVDPGRGEVPAVELDDAPPLGVQVGLRDHARDVRADRRGVGEELQLRRRVLLGGVGHEQHGVGRRQRGRRRRAVHRRQPADPGGVDDLQPAAQEGPGQPDLGVAPPLPVAGVALLADVVGELVARDPDALAVGPDQRDVQGLGVPHDGRHGRGDVVERRADGCARPGR